MPQLRLPSDVQHVRAHPRPFFFITMLPNSPDSPKPNDSAKPSIMLDLALQGGGAHGAFTWGVLDRLLDDDGIEIGRISGASAGALNGAALVCGYVAGGRMGAKRNLALLWQKACEAGTLMAMFHFPLRKPGLGVWDDAMPVMSPYQTSPLAQSHLRYLVSTVANFDRVKCSDGPQLFVNAVNVNTGRTRVFGPEEMSVSAVMASACAPFMFPAVMIDDNAYWDGSYGGNPSLGPLLANSQEADIFMVELTPQVRVDTPMTAKNILNRINELASISALRADLRHVQMLNETGRGAIRLHVLSLPEALSDLEAEPSTKRTVSALLFESLRQKGYAACDEWLSLHRESLGKRSSVDLAARYL